RLESLQDRSLVPFRQFSFFDFSIEILCDGLERAIEKALLHVAQNHLVSRACKHLCDAVAHGSRTQHRHALDRIDGHFASPLPGTLDRKSTRLNSSHVAISYAVFCLKKKKNLHTE